MLICMHVSVYLYASAWKVEQWHLKYLQCQRYRNMCLYTYNKNNNNAKKAR